MTREEALEAGIREAWRLLADGADAGPAEAAAEAVACCYPDGATPDELEGFAVGFVMVATEVAEIARKRREAGGT